MTHPFASSLPRAGALLLSLCMLAGCSLLPGKSKEVSEDDFSDSFEILGDPVPYVNDFSVEGDDPAGLVKILENAGQLTQLIDSPPDSELGLIRRARSDASTAKDILHSQGYYDGSVSYTVDTSASPAKVSLVMKTGERYTLDESSVVLEKDQAVPDEFRIRHKKAGLFGMKTVRDEDFTFPQTLDLNAGDPAVASSVTDAVDALPVELRKNGYPFAYISSTRYTLNRNEKTLHAKAVLRPGPPAYLGAVMLDGCKTVNAAYVERLRPWKDNTPWSSDILIEYREALRKTGLFETVDVKPAVQGVFENVSPGKPITLPVSVSVKEGPMRSVTGGISYSTDKGFGSKAAWEHRNLFGNAERFKISLPFSQDLKAVSAEFTKPDIFVPDLSLVLGAGAGIDNTEAYEKRYVEASAGFEHKLSDKMTLRSALVYERAVLKSDEHDYNYLKWDNSFRLDTRSDRLNPKHGILTVVSLFPFVGKSDAVFSGFGVSLDQSLYHDVGHDIILAGRYSIGAAFGPSWQSVPAPLRFFQGGGGSVRGFAYQSLGPRKQNSDPAGGLSYQLVNAEARIGVAKNFYVVPFVDGGMVYTSSMPKWKGRLALAAGLGFRYVTPIGPLRFDLAVPLNSPYEDGGKPKKRFQVYISIGQAF
ncbi:MAG: BamA/TamA family outer membrane protein [Mailhella sp.]|nr:BamA/TamA family outer membrane protein [Mailhella sp.]